MHPNSVIMLPTLASTLGAIEPVQILQVTLQAIASLAIVGSLTFAALQLRHWRRAYQVMNFTKLVELQMMLRKMRVEDPSLARVFKDDMQGLTTDDEVRQYFFNLMQMSIFEIAWYSRCMGQLGEDYFQSWAHRIQLLRDEESFRRMMDHPGMKFMHDDFQRYMRDVIASSGPNQPAKQAGTQAPGIQRPMAQDADR
jgi:hypothetical protein